jgi:excisionase family DNA binding protein
MLTVLEFCKRHKLDPGNVRRLLIAGRIPGTKFGRDWMIPETAVKPADKRRKVSAEAASQ